MTARAQLPRLLEDVSRLEAEKLALQAGFEAEKANTRFTAVQTPRCTPGKGRAARATGERQAGRKSQAALKCISVQFELALHF